MRMDSKIHSTTHTVTDKQMLYSLKYIPVEYGVKSGFVLFMKIPFMQLF